MEPARAVTGRDDIGDRVGAIRALIALEPGSEEGSAGFLARMCRAAARELSASGVGVTLMTGDAVRGLGAASDQASERVEELQFVLGEGPCIDAWTDRRPVLTADLAGEAMTRWPVYAPAAYEAGVRAVFTFPLQIGAARLGVMDVFRAGAGALTDDEISTALAFADATLEVLLDQQENRHRQPGRDRLRQRS